MAMHDTEVLTEVRSNPTIKNLNQNCICKLSLISENICSNGLF